MTGITIDCLDDWQKVCETAEILFEKSKQKWWIRVVFDLENDPKEYASPLEELAGKASIVGEIVDSYQLDNLSVKEHRERCMAYGQALKTYVSCWEIGNEINGSWTGNPGQVRQKEKDAFRLLKFPQKPRLLTVYIENGEPDPWQWSKEHLPEDVRTGIEWLGISYYGPHLSVEEWVAVFRSAQVWYPQAKVLISECGFQNCDQPESEKRARWAHYYQYLFPKLEGALTGFIGGGFWWYGWQDKDKIVSWV